MGVLLVLNPYCGDDFGCSFRVYDCNKFCEMEVRVMTDREKLIAIVKTAPFEGQVLDYWWFEEKIAKITDHLIANGVVVREKGEWKPVKYNAHCSCGKSYGTYHYECQVCHRVSYAQPYGLNFCPNCGADMRRRENG